jgi:hypothetical protein
VIDQVRRLQTGQVQPDKFDFNALKFGGMRFGLQALHDLQDNWRGPQAEYVHAQAKAALALKAEDNQGKYQRTPVNAETRSKVIVAHTKNGKLPASLINQYWDYTEGPILIPNCLRFAEETCHAWIVKGRNNVDIVLLLAGNMFTGFQQKTDKTWTAIGSWTIPHACKDKIRSAESGAFKMVAPLPALQSDIDIAGLHARFVQNESNIAC